MRTLPDDALVVFLSDTHIGGDEGRDIFETPDDLIKMLAGINAHQGPVELVLAGDFFDFLRIANVPPGRNRLQVTMGRPEYRDMFAALRRFAAGADRHVVYLPGNHDAEAWWNHEINRQILSEGLVHEFALDYAAEFASSPGDVVYCQHGNQFDPTNEIHDYDDPLDTPLGDHVVTQLTRPLANRRIASLDLNDVDRVFPLGSIPAWAVGRLFYQLIGAAALYFVLPLLVAFYVYEQLAYLVGHRSEVSRLTYDLTYDLLAVIVVFALFVLVTRRAVARTIRSFSAGPQNVAAVDPVAASVAGIRDLLESGAELPMTDGPIDGIAVFVSGHTHAPSLDAFTRPGGAPGALVNSGCWLRQLQPVAAHIHLPPVFVSRYVQTHVRVHRGEDAIEVELWERPRAAVQDLRRGERLALAGRMPADLKEEGEPRVRARTAVSFLGSPLQPSEETP